jgi:hypothetical protein
VDHLGAEWAPEKGCPGCCVRHSVVPALGEVENFEVPGQKAKDAIEWASNTNFGA